MGEYMTAVDGSVWGQGNGQWRPIDRQDYLRLDASKHIGFREKTPRERAFDKLNEERDLARRFFSEELDDSRRPDEWGRLAWRYLEKVGSLWTADHNAEKFIKAASVLMAAYESYLRKQDKAKHRSAELARLRTQMADLQNKINELEAQGA